MFMYRQLNVAIQVYTAIGAAEGKAWHLAGLFRNPDKCSNWTMERTCDNL